MKITGSHSHALPSSLPGQVEQAQHTGSASTSDTFHGVSDSVELSQDAQFMQRVVQEAKRSEGVSSQRLAELREQVQRGVYQPPIEQLATILAKELF